MSIDCSQLHLEPGSFLGDSNPHSALAVRYLEQVMTGARGDALALLRDAFEAGTSIRDIYVDVFQGVLYEIGRLWDENRISVAHEHLCAVAVEVAMAHFLPHVCSSARTGMRMVAACVPGERHSIGARMVADFFEMAGWDSTYLGADIPTESVARLVLESGASLVALSASTDSSVAAVAEAVDRLRAELPADIIILVGGRPFQRNPELVRQTGADGTAARADQVLELVHSLRGGPR